jgi:O-acetyl-ADP-ribose deacetylase (regulator of RNase III)
MIQYKTGNLIQEEVEAIVNTVNCVGIMGRGLALQFKKSFPDNFKSYESACKKNEILIGKMFVHETRLPSYPKFIINFPTKRHWREVSHIEYIEMGLMDLKQVIENLGITSIAIPPLGCGLGGLNWNHVKPYIEKMFQDSPIHVIVFEPLEISKNNNIDSQSNQPIMTVGRAALIELIHRYFNGLLDPFITLLEVHKLLYFLQETGEDLRLTYIKAWYGPYAENLRHVLNVIEGFFVSGYQNNGDQPSTRLKLLPGAHEEAITFLKNHESTKLHLDRVVDLIDGFESMYGLELLSTIHWVVNKDGAKTLEEVIDKTYQWNDQKKQFTQKQIKLALDILLKKNWITLH